MFIFLPKETRGGKLQPTNYCGVLVGYDDQSKAYRLYDPATQNIVISHQVHVLEQQLDDFGPSSNSLFSDVFAPLFDTTGEVRALQVPIEVPFGVSPDPPDRPLLDEVVPLVPQQDLPLPADKPLLPDLALGPAPLIRCYPSPERQPPPRNRDYSGTDEYSFVVQTSEPIFDDITISQALSHSGWKAAMQEELDSLLGTGTWELGPLPPGQHALSSKWIFKTKPEKDATRFCLKARLVARGFEQQFGIDYKEMFAPLSSGPLYDLS